MSINPDSPRTQRILSYSLKLHVRFQKAQSTMKQRLTLLLCLIGFLVVLSSVGVVECRKKKKFIYATPPSCGTYKTLVGLDGGGIRGIIPAFVLLELENAIKRYILANRQDMLPKNTAAVQSYNDFEISLADYIDCFAGTSIGSLLALFLASKGGNGKVSDFLDQKSVRHTHGRIAPTSAKALIAIFSELSNDVFPPDEIPVNMFATGTQDDSPGYKRAWLYQARGLREMATELLGETKLSELRTSCLVVTYDLIRRSQILMFYDALSSPPKYGFSHQNRINTPRPAKDPVLKRAVQAVYEADFLLSDIGIGSSSLPPAFPAHITRSRTKPEQTLSLVDGVLFLLDPTFPAVAHIANSTGDSSLDNIAVLSIGCGVRLRDFSSAKNGGKQQWDLSGMRSFYAGSLYPEVLSKQLSFMFSGSLARKPGKFLRIQPVGKPGTNLSDLFRTSTVSALLPQFRAVGENTAKEYKPAIESFVKKFIFEAPEDQQSEVCVPSDDNTCDSTTT